MQSILVVMGVDGVSLNLARLCFCWLHTRRVRLVLDLDIWI